MNTIVYRCENDKQNGPYKISETHYEDRRELLDHHNSERYPAPWEEDLPLDLKYYCGFVSIEQMKRWFTGIERDALRQWGWKFFKLEVCTPVYTGKCQCVFERKDATIIEEISE